MFFSGGALGFDTLAALAVLELRRRHPDVSLVMVLPCQSQSSRWGAGAQQEYRRILKASDRVLYVSEEYFPGCMQKRNRFMVDHSDTCCCYLTSCRGGTWNTVSYAYDQHLSIHNLASDL